MQHCSESIQAYEKLALGEQHAFLEHFIQVETKNTLKALLITCVRMRSWQLLHQALQESDVREILWVVIDDLLSLAHADGTEDLLLQHLPDSLSEKEGRIALVFPCRIASWPLAERLIARGALPGKETFTRAFSGYISQAKNPFEFQLLTAVMADHRFGWNEILGFPSTASASDVLKRGKTSSKPAYLLCAFALMGNEQKAEYIVSLYSSGELPLIYPHIRNNGSWMKYLPAEVKGKILSDDIGM